MSDDEENEREGNKRRERDCPRREEIKNRYRDGAEMNGLPDNLFAITNRYIRSGHHVNQMLTSFPRLWSGSARAVRRRLCWRVPVIFLFERGEVFLRG